MISFDTRVIDVIDRAPGVKSFRFAFSGEFAFRPGQFFFVGIIVNGREAVKHFSFSNSPTETGYIEFTKRLTDSDFSKALAVLKPGDTARIKGPLGNFIYEGIPGKAAFLSGGIGITPIRSILKYIADKGISSDIALFYGNNTKKDIIFKKDLDAMAQSVKNLKIIYTLTSAQAKDLDGWKGRTGFINSDMIREEVPDYAERVFYLCGPPAMVSVLDRMLIDNMSFPKERLIKEGFTGY
ncbi:MAG: FAD-binding oxidoreductase [Candidatus Omnitrophica bacterium]|jgi:ferredoxin-NADP reductase|nr:FAD-binding oxidoreductase [Candidatus Omnitrophota bacterium]